MRAGLQCLLDQSRERWWVDDGSSRGGDSSGSDSGGISSRAIISATNGQGVADTDTGASQQAARARKVV